MAKKAQKKNVAKKTKAKAKPAPKKTTKKSPKRRQASGLGIASLHIDFMTYKVDQLKKFYEGILELSTETSDDEGLNYLLVRTSPESTMGFMPPHPDMRGEQPLPREPTLYFEVKDVDRAYAQLIAKGAAFAGPPVEMPWGDRVVTTTDPEGRTVMLASKAMGKKARK
jgi:predicted enzyme related to lactoylglutathione lyase